MHYFLSTFQYIIPLVYFDLQYLEDFCSELYVTDFDRENFLDLFGSRTQNLQRFGDPGIQVFSLSLFLDLLCY